MLGKTPHSMNGTQVDLTPIHTYYDTKKLVFLHTDDFRIFCGDLGNEVTDDVLIRVFNKYPSFQKVPSL